MTYGRFAYLYDELMKDVPYDKWVELILEKTKPFAGKKILDIGCGTGELSLRFAALGYDVTGVDLSDHMLAVAQEKAYRENVSIQFIEQNMAELQLVETYDLIGVFCDSLNYLESEDEVKSTFRGVNEFLKEDGLFIFDVHSLYKINEIFGNETFSYDEEGIFYLWNCFQGEYPNSVEHELTFFVEDEGGKYDRFDESHLQRTFPKEIYSKWLEEAGFQLLEIIGDFNGPPKDDSERIFFIAAKK